MSTRIKFCGLTRESDVDVAVSLGVDMLGLVFVPKSRRCVSIAHARVLRRKIPSSIQVVALVMDAEATFVEEVVSHVKPDLIQFHGQENLAYCTQFGVPFMKAFAMGAGAEGSVLSRVKSWSSAYAVLFDGHGVGEVGGSGQRFDWSSLPTQLAVPFLLAGGLEAANVAEAIALANPWGVDVSSGIEQAPGIKDAQRMKEFVAAIRA